MPFLPKNQWILTTCTYIHKTWYYEVQRENAKDHADGRNILSSSCKDSRFLATN